MFASTSTLSEAREQAPAGGSSGKCIRRNFKSVLEVKNERGSRTRTKQVDSIESVAAGYTNIFSGIVPTA